VTRRATTPDEPPWNVREYPSRRSGGERSSFEVDRDRVIHAQSFRQLQRKTQVQGLVRAPRGPGFRTRLNHVIEVGQIGRGIAIELAGDQALVEAIALAHDLGHPPFGHAGERALQNALNVAGETEWNANVHSLTVVEQIELASSEFPGLNLTWATREGIARHSTPFDRPVSEGRFAETPSSGVEAQIVDAADVFAYLSHDLDDALADGFVSLDEVASVSPVLKALTDSAERDWTARRYEWPDHERQRLVSRLVVARLIGSLIRDVAEASRERLSGFEGDLAREVRAIPDRVVVQSDEYKAVAQDLLRLLTARYYRSDAVRQSDANAETLITSLFEWYAHRPEEIPERFRIGSEAVSAAAWIASLNDDEATIAVPR
jgi:dGTPase